MLLQGIAGSAHERDFALLLWLGQSHEDKEHFARKVLGNRQMDGMVIASLQSDHPLIDMLPDIKIPLVTVDRPEVFDDQISYVTVDNIAAAVDAVTHLISIGRRRIAHITGHLTITDGQDRLMGYRKALEIAGFPFDPALVYHGAFSYDEGYAGMKHLLAQRPDALFAAGDTIAMGALQALREAGLHVPEDVAIVGFDDLNETLDSKPPLTTVRQPVQQKGAQAAHLLIDLIEGKRVGPHHVLLPTELIVRQSTRPVYPPLQTQYKGGEVPQQV
jgi:DNA-binding LacI/PurR family transcriptional regulator